VLQPIPEYQSSGSADAILRPRLVYDGDCGFCGYWARYWQALTGDAVEFRTYQDVGTQYPGIPTADFRNAVQFITPDGQFAGGAEASFRTLNEVPGR
jgi:predicted DCC family thiol-disulfide oxidoreductase YuxK